MQSEAVIAQPLIAWGVSSRAVPGQDICGDLHLVKSIPDGVMVAVVDGLGHGAEASAAARIAINLLERYDGEPLGALVNLCHAALIKTRGVVMTVAVLKAAENWLTWLGVGNVEAALLPAAAASQSAAEGVLLRESRTAGTFSK